MKPFPIKMMDLPFSFSDQIIMSVLEDRYGPLAAEKFGDCLDHFRNSVDEDAMVETVNQTLEAIGAKMRVTHIIEILDDGYLWGICVPSPV